MSLSNALFLLERELVVVILFVVHLLVMSCRAHKKSNLLVISSNHVVHLLKISCRLAWCLVPEVKACKLEWSARVPCCTKFLRAYAPHSSLSHAEVPRKMVASHAKTFYLLSVQITTVSRYCVTHAYIRVLTVL